MSINLYSSHEGKISVGTALNDELPGAATPYIPGDAAADVMYAYKVSRNCGNEPNCLQLSIDNCPRLNIVPNMVVGRTVAETAVFHILSGRMER